MLEGQAVLGFPDPGAFNARPLFGHDALAGYRFAFNDEDSKAITASVVIDVLRPQEFLFNLTYSQRLGEVWGLAAGLHLVHLSPQRPESAQRV